MSGKGEALHLASLLREWRNTPFFRELRRDGAAGGTMAECEDGQLTLFADDAEHQVLRELSHELAEIYRVHQMEVDEVGSWCRDCGLPWPCDAARVIDALDRVRAERDALASAFCAECRNRLVDGWRYAVGTCLHCQGERLEAEMIAKAEGERRDGAR